ncbi:aldo/keto reductase [Clostridium butyricum]|uniref:Aldo/keto reductase n=1 Tax=Clostridium butyricum E4 str. BoNT E BL5262 TaxID=632245 RepID=C4IBV5_CLOBU|nr:aldo/keto reductase [Clostridium butyricum]EDT74108.1 putative aryl-alcohol dehydrogenase W [Clostridium butyricum 5521]EEP56294.1 aldo/keto reductase [Clostridium butyricum E4 str. BoNT E BL5262]NFL32264.1 aldo/keto reductase [Clostridium butyricum]NFS16474.1 aldo/keto reductase [Clostridium butyricum]
MKYIKLGNSDLNVSRICLGCMGFGDAEKGMHKWTLDEKKSAEIIKVALDYGINFFDTAVAYQNGTSEKYLGSAIRKFAKREDVVIATKFLPRIQDEINKGVSGREHIIQSLDTSLSNLGMDFIDLYIYHMWDYNTPIEEVMETLNDVITEGKVRYIGISNCYAWQLQKANMIAQMNGWNKFVSVQSHYNLIFRETEREMTGCCIDGNIAMTPYSGLASGRLVKDSSETSERLEKDSFAKGKYDKTADVDRIIIERVAEIANKRKMTRIQIALGWLLTKVTSPIIGATKISHVEEAVKAISVQLSDDEIAHLEEPYVPHKLVGVMAGKN